MRSEEIKRMVSSTSDAAFAIDCQGLVVAWNQAAEALLALPALARLALRVLGRRPCSTPPRTGAAEAWRSVSRLPHPR